MKTTGLEAVLSALRGDSGLTGADKVEPGANPAFTAAFDEAARAAAQSSPASRPGAANSNPTPPSREAAAGGKSLPDTGSELPAEPSSQGPQTSPADAGTADAAAVSGTETLAAAAFAPDEPLTPNPVRPGTEQAVAGVARTANGPATIPTSATVAGAVPVAAGEAGADADTLPGDAGRAVQAQTLTNAPGNAAAGNAGFAAAVRSALGVNQAATDSSSRAIPNAEVARGVTPGQASGAALSGTTNTTASAVPTANAGEVSGAPVTNNPMPSNPVANGTRTDGGPLTPAPATGAEDSPRVPGANPLTNNAVAAGTRTEGGTLTPPTTGAGEAPRAEVANPSTRNPVATAARTEGGPITPAQSTNAGETPRATVPEQARASTDPAPQAAAPATETMAQRAARLAAGLRPDANAQGSSATTSNGLDQDGPLSGAVLQNTQDMRSAVVPEPRTVMPMPEPGAQPELSSRAVDAPASTASGLAPASARGADTTTSPSVMQLPDIRQAPQGSEFPQEILARVRMIQSQNGKEARLNLHPAELGRLQIAITSEGEATRVAFVVENAQAKEALEQAMPRLREFLQQAGLQLTDSSVAQQDFRDSSGFASGDDGAEQKGSALAGDSDGEQDAPGPSGSDPDRIVDAYV